MTTAMIDKTPVSSRPEPVLIERARRTGWLLLTVAVAAMLTARIGPEAVRVPAIVAAVAAGLFGLLAIINVALVRGLYRQLSETATHEE